MSGKVMVIGSGGREHAIVWKLNQSEFVKEIYVAPGSHAIQQVAKAQTIDLDIKNFENVASWCKANQIELVAVGPEDPLANGIADVLTKQGIHVFGPQKNAAMIESNKDWAKAFMDRHNVPTARWQSFTDVTLAKNFINNADFAALVVKASGLAAGKGVVVAKDKNEACEAVDNILGNKKYGNAGEVVVIEELLQGEEVSVLAFCDGNTVKPMLPSQDHKRIFDGDLGPNTGGMGAYCPCPLLNNDQLKFVEKNILQQTVNGFKKENIKFVGVLYAGLMMTENGPKVLEFNCRFGDPETEVLLPLLESDLYTIMKACCTDTLQGIQLKWKENVSAVGVVVASRGYPETSSKGQVIKGIELINQKKDHVIFHCATQLKENEYLTNGGRVMILVSLAPNLTLAAANATLAATTITFDGKQFRKDIAHKGIAKAILEKGKLTYKASGVDITAGNELVNHIKPAAKSTDRPGVLGALGGFGGLFDVQAAGYKSPLLVSGTDGVGTKLKIAQKVGIHDTIGIDLVAMCVNDVLAHGAEPLFFLDYFACGNLDVNVAKQVVNGVAEGCRRAGCTLIGGETAEMPDMYSPGEYDLAGFAVGAVEKDMLLPHIDQIVENDIVIGLPSSGVHSNGFSLVRKVMNLVNANYNDVAPFSKTGRTFGQELLTPTKIYVKPVISAIKTGKVKAFAHITGGGLLENIPRILPKHLGVRLNAKNWKMNDVFPWLAAAGGVNKFEMLRTFNCSIGGVLVVKQTDANEIVNLMREENATIIGEVIASSEGEQVIVNNFTEVMEPLMRSYIAPLLEVISPIKKRVGVLISGSGTNLQALIDATLDPSKHMGAEIVIVISNKANVEGLKRAERVNIPTKVLNHKNYESREAFDRAMHAELLAAGVEIVCLAGFMRILSGEFTALWKGKLLNIHPALLPSFKGTHAQRQALEAGVRITGCSVHFVERDVDAGAIITQEAVPIEKDDTEEILIERIKVAEHRAFPRALKLLATGKISLGSDDKIIWH